MLLFTSKKHVFSNNSEKPTVSEALQDSYLSLLNIVLMCLLFCIIVVAGKP